MSGKTRGPTRLPVLAPSSKKLSATEIFDRHQEAFDRQNPRFDPNFVNKHARITGLKQYPFKNRGCQDLEYLKSHVDKRHLNLQSTKKIFDKYHVNYCLCGGTLLGPVRDGDLILNDYDDDLYIFQPLSNDCIKEFLLEGFTICRADEGLLISVVRHGAPIDFIFKQIIYPGLYSYSSYRFMTFNDTVKFYENMSTINLRGFDYPIPNKVERYLEFLYSDWKKTNPYGKHRGNNNPKDPYIVFLKEERDSIDLNLYKTMRCKEGVLEIFFI